MSNVKLYKVVQRLKEYMLRDDKTKIIQFANWVTSNEERLLTGDIGELAGMFGLRIDENLARNFVSQTLLSDINVGIYCNGDKIFMNYGNSTASVHVSQVVMLKYFGCGIDEIIKMAFKYISIDDIGTSARLTQDVYKSLFDNGVMIEGFASPFNVGLLEYGGSYCSRFADDFMSLGTFENKSFANTSVLCFPPQSISYLKMIRKSIGMSMNTNFIIIVLKKLAYHFHDAKHIRDVSPKLSFDNWSACKSMSKMTAIIFQTGLPPIIDIEKIFKILINNNC